MENLMDSRPLYPDGQLRGGKTAREALLGLWRALDMPDEAMDYVDLSGREPVLPSSFPVGTAAQASMAAAALAAAGLCHLRGDRKRVVSGKRLSVRVVFGGRRINKKKNTQA